MKIQAINNNTNFKGLFTNKSHENGGDWKMEYRPYSWESNNTSKMQAKQRVDVYASTLPDNEEIFETRYNGYESSRDILGTESYYKHSDGTMRKTITEAPAMNREESLKVQNNKLESFLQLKRHEMNTQSNFILNTPQELSDSAREYDRYSSDIKHGYFSRSYSLDSSYRQMDNEYSKTKDRGLGVVNAFKNYVKLRDSSEDVKRSIAQNTEELALIENAKKERKLIDISNRSIYDPNRALWEEVSSDIKAASEKTLVLPHKTISMKSLLKSINPANILQTTPTQVIHFVDSLIKNIR